MGIDWTLMGYITNTMIFGFENGGTPKWLVLHGESSDKSIRFNGSMLFKDKYKLVMYL